MRRDQQIAMVLGIDPMKVEADSMTLEPIGNGWLVRWTGIAVLYEDAGRTLFGGENS